MKCSVTARRLMLLARANVSQSMFTTLKSRVKVNDNGSFSKHVSLVSKNPFPSIVAKIRCFSLFTQESTLFSLKKMEINCYYNIRQCDFNHKRKHLWKPSVMCKTEPMEDFE